MKNFNLLFILVGGLMILGCKPPMGGSEGQRGQVTLTATASPSDGGTIARSPDKTEYEPGTVVILTANPESGYQFSRWEGDATGSENPVQMTLDRGKTAKAVFIQSSLTVWSSPSSGGTVTVSPTQTLYEPGTNVTLTAVPTPGYVFVRWQGASGSGNPTTITMNGARSIAAVFGYNSLNLTIKAGRYGTVATVEDPNYQVWTEIPCGSVLLSPNQSTYEYGTIVTLTANPISDYQFARWETVTTTYDTQSGQQEVATSSFSENPVTTITMDSDEMVRAVFVPAKPFIGLSQDQISESLWTGGKVPSSVTIQITNDGVGTLSGLALQSGNTIDFSCKLSGTTAPATLTVTFADSFLAEVESIPEGWSSQWLIRISSPVAMNSPQTINVSATHIPKPVPYTPPPNPYPVSPKVICAELHRQGLMDEIIFKADEAFGRHLRDSHRDVLLGYQLWAKPVVRWMQKSRTVTRIVASVATPWAYEMAYRMGARNKGSFAGTILMDAGVPICKIIGWALTWAGNTDNP
jgi:hypothetical protein